MTKTYIKVHDNVECTKTLGKGRVTLKCRKIDDHKPISAKKIFKELGIKHIE